MNRQNLRPDELVTNKEETRLIWLDANIDNSDDSNQTQIMLLGLNSAAQFYTDPIRCINAIKSIKDEQVLFIISGSLAQNVLPEIHSFKSIVAIFIFCVNRENYVSLIDEFDKIVEIFIDQDSLLKSLHQTLNLLEKQTITFSSFNQKQKSSRDLSKESASFLWHQMILHVLTEMPQDDQSKKDLLEKCQDYYQFDKIELKKIDEFQKHYYREKAIEWYTEECFLYKLLNKALRTEDIELIYSFRFFIIDLCSDIKQEHCKLKNNDVFTVYRGQKISIAEFNKWQNNIDTIISINGFFSTSRDINVSVKFARQGVISDDNRSVLFEVKIDPSLESVIYADISDRSHHKNEQEILFNLNSLFKIISVELDLTYEIWKIQLEPSNGTAENTEQYLTYVRQQMDNCSPIIYFGWLLLNELGQINQAKKYFEMLLKTLPSDHQDIAAVYNGIGRVHSESNKLTLALEYYEIAYHIRQKQSPPNDVHLVASLNNIASILKEKRDFDQALDYYKQALLIEEKNCQGDHWQKAVIIQNIGNTFLEKGDLINAFDRLSNALDMFQRTSPNQYSKISTCLGNLGLVYEKNGDLEKALYYYHKELEMDEQCLPLDHPYVSKDHRKIVVTYMKNKQIDKAREFCRKKLDFQKNNLGDNHPCIAKTLMTMAKIFEENCSKVALQYYREALINLEKSTPIDQLAIAKCLTSTGRSHGIFKEFDSALQCLVKALDLYCHLLPSDHVDIAIVCRIIGLCYQKTNKSSEALDYFDRSLRIYRDNYGSEHENVKLIEGDIAKLTDEQQIPTHSIESVDENVNNEQVIIDMIDSDPHLSSTEPVDKNVSNEQLITVVIDPDPCISSTEPSSLQVVDSASTPKDARSETKNEVKTPVKKRKICPRCEIL